MITFNRQGAFFNALMLTSLVAVISGPVHRFLPQWQPGYLVGASLLVALEASLIHHTFRRERMWMSEGLRYLVPEIMVMFVLMRIAATLSIGAATLANDARRWLYDPLSIFDPAFIATILLGLVVGGLSHAAMQDLVELAPGQFETKSTEDGDQRAMALIAEDRRAALKHISNRFVIGGVVLLICLGLEAVNIERIEESNRTISSLSAGGALCYVVSGFLLYSQARLALLQARWRLDGAHVAEGIPRRWTSTSWIIIGGVTGTAALLPRSYGLGLLDTIRSVLGIVGYMLAILGYLLLWLFSLLVLLPAWILSLFMRPGTTAPPPAPPQLALPNPPPQVTHEPRLLTAIIFWMCIILLAGYALWIVAQRHPGLVRTLTHWRPLRSLLQWMRTKLGTTQTWVNQAIQVVQSRLARPSTKRSQRTSWLHLSRMAPRELILYFYRSTLRRAAERGLPRQANQTPYEYSATLSAHLPETQSEVHELTEAFVAAQYSPQALGREDANRTRRLWERVRSRLRNLNNSKPG